MRVLLGSVSVPMTRTDRVLMSDYLHNEPPLGYDPATGRVYVRSVRV
ncbi:MAG: hypothetical protein KF902_02705 [Phycisphaeraceae bacterium]|nr:hypothetical protein [Phycisphaeraceae bacterium]